MTLTPDALVSAALAIAAASDLASRRIPNALVLTAGLAGLAVSAGAQQLVSGLTASIICLCVTVPGWRRGFLGGGDVKLAAAAATWVGLDHLPVFALTTALLGGLLSVLVLVMSSSSTKRLVRANATASLATGTVTIARSASTSIPYGVAIAAGAAIAMSMSGALS